MERSEQIICSEFVPLCATLRNESPRCGLKLTDLAAILGRYSLHHEPWRFYHNAEHIADGLMKFRTHERLLKNRTATLLAWLMHDVIYVPGAPTNEWASAQFAQALLERACVPGNIILVVTEMILATKGHQVPANFSGTHSDLELMLDIDLSGFGDSQESFMEVGERLRREAAYFSDKEYEAGTRKFMENMLRRRPFFLTEAYVDRDEQAHANIRHLLESKVSALVSC